MLLWKKLDVLIMVTPTQLINKKFKVQLQQFYLKIGNKLH